MSVTVYIQENQDLAAENDPEGSREKLTFTKNRRPVFTQCALLSFGGAARRRGQIGASLDRFLMSFLNNRRIALSHHIHKRWLHFGVARQQKGHGDCDIRPQQRRGARARTGTAYFLL